MWNWSFLPGPFNPSGNVRLATALLLGLACLASAQEPGRWRMQYFYDKENATFVISDLKFPSVKREPFHFLRGGGSPTIGQEF